MDNLNNIPNAGNWGDAASKLNDNFNKVQNAITTVENVSKNNKGYFTSLSALNTAFPSPKAGQTAYVYGEASSTNYYIYNAVNGSWVASSIEAPSVGVDIAGYTKTGGSTKTTKDIDDTKANHGYASNPKTLKEVDDDLVQSIRNISGNWFSNPGKFVQPETGVVADTPNDNIITDYLDITNVNKIIIKGRSTPLVALCAFYSEDKTFISSIYGDDKDKKTIEITDIPSNAKYVIGSGYGLGDDSLILYTAESLSKDIQDLHLDLHQSIKNISGNWFSIPEKYVNVVKGDIINTPGSNIITDYLDITNVNKIIIKGKSTHAVALCAFYSESKNYISSISGLDKDKKTIEITEIPDNAKYIVATGHGFGDDFLILSTTESLSKDIQDLKNSIDEKKTVTINLDSTVIEEGYWWREASGDRSINPVIGTHKHNTPVAVQLGDEFITSSSIDSRAESASFHALLDENMNIIGPILTSDGYVITQDMIDAGVKYISFSYRLADDKSLAVRRITDIIDLHEQIVKNKEDISNIELSLFEDKSIIINLDSTITERGYWWYLDDERAIWPENTYRHNTPVAVQLGDEFNTSSSIISTETTRSFHAMLDEDMNIIGALISAHGYKITQELIDAGVRYVSFSYRPDDEKALTLRRVVDIPDIYNKISKNKSDIKILQSKVGNMPYISGIGAMGASLMYPGNVWFVDAVNSLGAIPYNKAESGVGTQAYFADKLWRGTYCTDEEFENMDILAIQFASSPNLERTNDLLPTADNYTDSFDIGNPSNQFLTYGSHQQLDYILKFWQKWCFDQKDNPSSKWYGVQHGKPFRVIFVTHWHDARPYYSDAIRIVAERWGCPVCEFDKKIGFSKNQPLPDMTQVSVLYAEDTQEIEGVTYGWHPKRGLHSEYIQGKMAFIFADTIKEYFGLL